MERWVLLIEGESSPRGHMDRDREMFALLRKEGPNLVRVYRISGRGVTLGRTHRTPVPEDWQVNPDRVAVRPTGGGAVLHDGDLCFSIFLPWSKTISRSRHWPSLYESIHQILADFLETLGLFPEILRNCPEKSDRMTEGDLRPGLCFHDPVRGDLMMGGRKVLGGALAIGRNGVLYQGSLFVPGIDPVILSSLFEKWYCAKGRVALEKALVETSPALARRGHGCLEAVDTI
jgi:lipoate-protein ligase A